MRSPSLYRLLSEFRSDGRPLVIRNRQLGNYSRVNNIELEIDCPLMTATLMLGLGRVGSIPPVWAYNPDPADPVPRSKNSSYLLRSR